MLNPIRLIGIQMALLAGLACAGCGGDWKAETYPAKGTISVNGKPPVGAVLHFVSTAGKVDQRNSRPWAKVANDGSFTLGTYKPGDGAPPGQYAVTIVWPVDPSTPDPRDRLGFAFAKPEKSKWKVTIIEGENELPPIVLKGVTVHANPPMPGVKMPLPRKKSAGS